MANGSGQSSVSDALFRQATRGGPIIDPFQGLGRIALALSSRLNRERETDERNKRRSAVSDAVRGIIDESDIAPSRRKALGAALENPDLAEIAAPAILSQALTPGERATTARLLTGDDATRFGDDVLSVLEKVNPDGTTADFEVLDRVTKDKDGKGAAADGVPKTIAQVTAPILLALAQGKKITKAQKRALEIGRFNPEAVMLMQMLGQDIPTVPDDLVIDDEQQPTAAPSTILGTFNGNPVSEAQLQEYLDANPGVKREDVLRQIQRPDENPLLMSSPTGGGGGF